MYKFLRIYDVKTKGNEVLAAGIWSVKWIWRV